MKKLTFITGNIYKVKQVEYYLKKKINHVNMDLMEIQSLDLHEIVEHKVREAFDKVEEPVLVEDVGLSFNALGELPGPFIKWFLKDLGTEKICRLLDGFNDRSAIAKIAYGFYDGKEMKIIESATEGTIAMNPTGNKSFGWDPIFIPNGWIKTFGEVEFKEQLDKSLRWKALVKLDDFLRYYKKNK